MPPLVGWAAATGSLTLDALYPFAIVFLWTPPHFWALSLLIKDDYARTGVPMLPVVKGERATRRQILLYSVILTAFTVLPWATGLFGAAYLAQRSRARRGVRGPCRAPGAAPLATGGPAALPLLPRLPGPAVLRDGARQGALIEPAAHGPATGSRATSGAAWPTAAHRARRRWASPSSPRSSTSADGGDERQSPGRRPSWSTSPEPSWTPAFVAFGLAGRPRGDLRGLGLDGRRRGAGAAGASQVGRSDVGDDLRRLPRRQDPTTATLPATPMRSRPRLAATPLRRSPARTPGGSMPEVAPSEVQTRTMSRIERIPTELAALDDDQVADVAGGHLHRRALEAPVGRRGDDRVGHVGPDQLGVGVLPAAERVRGCRARRRARAQAAPRRSRPRRPRPSRSSAAPPRAGCGPVPRSGSPSTCPHELPPVSLPSLSRRRRAPPRQLSADRLNPSTMRPREVPQARVARTDRIPRVTSPRKRLRGRRGAAQAGRRWG